MFELSHRGHDGEAGFRRPRRPTLLVVLKWIPNHYQVRALIYTYLLLPRTSTYTYGAVTKTSDG